jgi:hypothetical protein
MNVHETGFVPGKGSAHDYVPAWVQLPGLYSTENETDPLAVIKLFTPDSSWTWYLLEHDGEDLAFGLVVGFDTEFGYVSLGELRDVKGKLGLRVERDLWFRPTPVTQLPEYVSTWGTSGPCKGSQEDQARPKPLPEGWQPEDIRFLLEKLEEGPLLVADTELGIPTIHDWKASKHLGFGLFRVQVEGATLHFNGGGAMARTPSGKGWCSLRSQGSYAYDMANVRKALVAYLDSGQAGDRKEFLSPEKTSPSPTGSVPLLLPSAAGPAEPEQKVVENDGSLSINASADLSAREPSSDDQEEFRLLESELLRGDLRPGGAGYLALLAVRRPETLRLVLDRVREDTVRRRLTENRLHELQRR